MSTLTYTLTNFTNLNDDQLINLLAKYEYETPQLTEGTHKYINGVEYIVAIRNEMKNRGLINP